LKVSNEMKSIYLGLFILLAAAIIPTMASAQTNEIAKGDIPFSFYAGNTRMPAGNYTIRVSDDERRLLLQTADGSAAAFVIELPTNSSQDGTPAIRFDEIGGTYFLRAVTDIDQQFDVAQSRMEKKLAGGTSVAEVRLPMAGL
jgi:hypothetical protein